MMSFLSSMVLTVWLNTRLREFDLIVADVMMPGLDGFAMAREIRRLSANVPIIFLTAKSTIDDVEEGFESGANDYLKKPFELRELLVRIKALLRNKVKDIVAEDVIYQIGQYRFNKSDSYLYSTAKRPHSPILRHVYWINLPQI